MKIDMNRFLATAFSLLRRKPQVKLLSGTETRLDNVDVVREFFYIEVVNEGDYRIVVTDIALVYLSPARRKTVRSIIIKEAYEYPVTVSPGASFRLHLVAPQIDFARLNCIALKLSTGKEIKQDAGAGAFVSTVALEAMPQAVF